MEDKGREVYAKERLEFNQFFCDILTASHSVAESVLLSDWKSYFSINIYPHKRGNIPEDKILISSQSQGYSLFTILTNCSCFSVLEIHHNLRIKALML